jgi:ABC-type multidrug transport system fused ATPase/permease subunit
MNYLDIIQEKQGAIKALKNWPSSGEINFKNFWTKYRPDLDYVIKGLNFSIKAGEKIGVCGRTGAGKSTIILSILRVLKAVKGNLIIDG